MTNNDTLSTLLNWLNECEKADKYIAFNPKQIYAKVADIVTSKVLGIDERIPVVPERDYSELEAKVNG